MYPPEAADLPSFRLAAREPLAPLGRALA